MLPEDFVKRLRTQKYLDAEQLVEALSKPSPVSVRINTRKWNRVPEGSSTVPWCPESHYLDKRPSFTSDPLFHSGCYYPQEASGMFIGEVFRQVADTGRYIRVLDLCAAPGGKSTHLSSLIGQRGLLVANEVIRQRASILADNITRWGAANTIVTQNDPSDYKRVPDYFDLILVDAPCSGEGMFRDAVARKEWSENNASLCAERQKRILKDVWPALKERGILIYSTCTFNPAENEENVMWLINNTNGESVKIDIGCFNGVTELYYQGIYGYGFYPGKIKGEGLFVSVIRKPGNSEKLVRSEKKETLSRLSGDDLKVVSQWTTLAEESLARENGEIISVAGTNDDYLYLKSRLRIIKTGTKLCRIKNRNYVPSHELALSQGFRKGSFPTAECDYSQAIAFLRRENLVLEGLQKGWLVMTREGVNLGFVNNIGNRINNYFPMNWRIRMNIPETGEAKIIKWNENGG